MESQNTSSLSIPAAIVLAGIIIAGAVYFTKNDTGGTNTGNPSVKVELSEENTKVTSEDHVVGNSNAKVTIIEYSDLECPFCKQFHRTMRTIMDEYGETDVRWVYRHLPLAQLHSKAPKEAEATECAAKLGGNDAFWKFTNRLFEITPANNGFDLAKLPDLAVEIGLDKKAFETCLSSGEMEEVVNTQYQNGVSTIQAFVDAGKTRGVGTPFSIFLVKGEEPLPIGGAASIEQMRQMIDQALQ